MFFDQFIHAVSQSLYLSLLFFRFYRGKPPSSLYISTGSPLPSMTGPSDQAALHILIGGQVVHDIQHCFSMMARRPLAPVFLSRVLSATSSMASSAKESSTPSISKSSILLDDGAFRPFRMRIRACPADPGKTTMGTRPMISGIIPNFTKSWGVPGAGFLLRYDSSYR